MIRLLRSPVIIALVFLLPLAATYGDPPASSWVYYGPDGTLQYQATAQGDKILDFSSAGYMSGTQNIPLVPVVMTLNPTGTSADDTTRIQNAINQVSGMPLVNGQRGAILFTAGTYNIADTLDIRASGVVLRGQGQGTNGTVFLATSPNSYNVIDARPNGSSSFSSVGGTTSTIATSYVPVGATSFTVAPTDISKYQVGDKIIVNRPSTQLWINDIHMDSTYLQGEAWSPNSSHTQMDRTITAINGTTITVNAGITTAIDSTNNNAYGGGTIFKYTTNRISGVGVENMRFDTVHASPTDVNHANRPLVYGGGVTNSWMRNTTTIHYYNGPYFDTRSENNTLQDTMFRDPVGDSTTGGDAQNGQYILFQRNTTYNSKAPFVTQAQSPGPNVFVFGSAIASTQSIGPHQKWASGTLWDNIKVTGNGGIELINRGMFGTGHGWAGANSVTWNSQAPWSDVASPQTAQNWAIGTISPDRRSKYGGPEGIYDQFGTRVAPNSLYIAQLKEQLGPSADPTVIREFAVGPDNNFTGLPTSAVVDANWKFLSESTDMPGTGAVVGFGNTAVNKRAAVTIPYSLTPQETVVSATLTMKIKSLADLTTNESFFINSVGAQFDFDMLGQLGWAKNQVRTLTLDLTDIYGPLLGPLQNNSLTPGQFNLFWNGNVSIDSIQLNLGTTGLAATAPRTWDGGGANTNWATAGNWDTTAPAVRDSLVFDGSLGLANTNNLAGATSFDGITFKQTAGAFVISGNSITLGDDIVDQSTAPQTINLPLILDATHHVDVVKSGSLTLGGPISGSGKGLIKTGDGTLRLTTSNTYNGSTRVDGGTLTLDFGPNSPGSILSIASTITMGQGNLAVNGAVGGSTQSVSGLTLNAGASAISVISNGAATNLNLGPVARAVGGSVNFTLPASGNITATQPNASFSGGQQTILGGYATVSGTTWAVSGSGGTPGAISGLTTYTTNTLAASQDIDITSSQTSAAAVTINSLRLSGNTAGQTVTLAAPLTIATGGILFTNPNDETITGSSITSGNGQDLILINKSNDRNLTIASQITGNIGLTLVGGPDATGTPNRGRFTLSNSSNNFVGPITIAAGRLQLNSSDGMLGNASNPIVILGGAEGGGQLFNNNVAMSATRQILMAGLGFAESASGGSYGALRARNTISSPILLTGDARIGTSNTGILAGAIKGEHELSLTADSGQALVVSSTDNDWRGGTRIERGRIAMGVVDALPTDTIVTFGSTVAPGGPWSPRGSATPTLDLNGKNTQIGGATIHSPIDTGYSGTPTITNNGAAPATLAIGNQADLGFGGQITNGTSSLAIVKLGHGTQTLSGNNSYSGGTLVGEGTLAAGHGNAFGTGGLAIAADAQATLLPGLTQTMKLTALEIEGGTAPTGKLDIRDNLVVIDYSGATPYGSLRGYLKSGLNLGGGFWQGDGIRSATAAAAGGATAIGIIESADLALLGRTNIVDPQSGSTPLDSNAVVLKYTYWGDADVDGDNDVDDFIFWSSAFPSASGATWFTGDFDYDGDNDVDDFVFWSSTFPTLAPLLGGLNGVSPVAVPEPAGWLLAAFGGSLLAWRLRRR